MQRHYQSRNTNEITYNTMKKGCVAVGITPSFLVPLFVVNAVSYRCCIQPK